MKYVVLVHPDMKLDADLNAKLEAACKQIGSDIQIEVHQPTQRDVELMKFMIARDATEEEFWPKDSVYFIPDVPKIEIKAMEDT